LIAYLYAYSQPLKVANFRMNNKLIHVLKTFSREEFKNFKRFVSSPYFNRNKPQVRMLDELKLFYGGFDSPKLSKDYLFAKIYPGKQYNDSTMRSLIADLLYLAEDFLACEKFNSDSRRKTLCLLQSLSERGLENVYKENMKALKLEKSGEVQADWEYFYWLHELEENLRDFRISHDRVVHKDGLRARIEQTEQSYLYLTLSYVIKMVMGLYKIWLYEQNFALEFVDDSTRREGGAIRNIIGAIDLGRLKEIIKCTPATAQFASILEVYLALLQILSDTADRNKYFEYKQLVLENLTKMSDFEKGFHYSSLINYCNLEHNFTSQEFNFKEELFELYEEMLYGEYYKNPKNVYLSVSLFRAMLLLALKLKKFSWAENFAAGHGKHLHPKHIANLQNYAAAMLAFEMHDYAQSLDNAAKVDLNNFILKYDLDILRLKIYYERRGGYEGTRLCARMYAVSKRR